MDSTPRCCYSGGSSSLCRIRPCLEGGSGFGSSRGFYHQGTFVIDAKNIRILTSILRSRRSILKHDISLYPFLAWNPNHSFIRLMMECGLVTIILIVISSNSNAISHLHMQSSMLALGA